MEKYFRISYGCGCGQSEDFITADSIDEAEEIAYDYAIQDYQSFEGLHGVRDMAQIAEEIYGDPDSGDSYDLSLLNEAQLRIVEIEYNEEVQSTIDYWAEEISYEEYCEEMGECDY